MDGLLKVLEGLAYVATMVGIPVAIVAFLVEKRRDRSQRERDTYIQANDRYIHYLTLCLDHPQLGCFDVSPLEPEVVASGLEITKLTLFTILISVLEAGFILYAEHQSEVRLRQWRGWDQYMRMWAGRPDFRSAWPVLGPQFDTKFVGYMSDLVRSTPPLLLAKPS